MFPSESKPAEPVKRVLWQTVLVATLIGVAGCGGGGGTSGSATSSSPPIPIVSASASASPVTLVQKSTTDWQITNGVLTVDYDPTGANLFSIVFNGDQMVDTTKLAKDGHAAGAYMDDAGLKTGNCTSSYTQGAATGTLPAYLDLAISCPSDTTYAFSSVMHYVFVSNDPGYHIYVSASHSATDIAGTDAAGTSIGQVQWILRDSWDLFTNSYSVDTALNNPGAEAVPLPSNADINTTDPGRLVQDATVDLSGFTDVPAGYTRKFYTKYDHAGYEYLHQVHGLYGTKYGVWVAFPSQETLNGGPTKQNLLQTANLLTIEGYSNHFLTSAGINVPAGQTYSRLFGPFYVRFNQLNTTSSSTGQTITSAADMYEDALKAGQSWGAFYDNEAALLSAGYVPSTGRGKVAITINNVVGKGITSTRSAWAVLSDNATNVQLSRMQGAQYWADISATGSATFTGVQPGTYRLTVYVLGQYGELRVDNIKVVANGTTTVPTQTFVPENFGTTLLTIGTPDRSSHEFLHGHDTAGRDLRNFYGAYNFWQDFASTQGVVTYYGTAVGSTPATNDPTKWNYTRWGKNGFNPGLFGGVYNASDDTTDGYKYVIPSYVASLSNASGTNGVSTVTPPWQIHFATPANYASSKYVTLTLSLACADGSVVASLNGNKNYVWSATNATDCMVRSGLSGFTQFLVLQFPISQLNTTVGGDNTLTLSASGTGDSDDAVRVELSSTDASPSSTGWNDYTFLGSPTTTVQPNDSLPNP